MTDRVKVLVCGDVQGNFRPLFDKVKKLHEKKGPFEFLLCVGEFFGRSSANWEPYKTGALKVPLLTYILGPNEESNLNYFGDPDGCELCDNVYFLGKRGILAGSGLRIAYVSGVENSGSEVIQITQKDVETVRDIAYKGKDKNEYLGIDVLLTSAWPKNVSDLVNHAEDDVKKAAAEGSPLLAWLAAEIKPRYHFAGLNNIYFERPPYRNYHPLCTKNTHCTRFIGLTSATGKKWVYGAVLTPIDKIKKEELYQRNSNDTDTPYKKEAQPEGSAKQFFFDMSGSVGAKRAKKPRMTFSKEQCWFCLSGGQDLQTVVHIGTDLYCCLPKGGLNDRHLICSPVEHLESYLHLSHRVRGELTTMKKSISEYYEKTNEVAVFFERYYKTSHMQLNAVPVPEKCAGRLKKAFVSVGQKHNVELSELLEGEELGSIVRLDTPYIYIELPGGSRLYGYCNRDFPLHFARIALASKDILNAKSRIDWKACTLPEEEEQELAKVIRKELAEFCSG